MPRIKKQDTDETWGYHGKPLNDGGRTPEQFAQFAQATRLRTLSDMSEREIRALERFYGCPVIRPTRPARGRAARAGAIGVRV